MKYYNIDTETEPKLTGSRNGVYSVEIKEKFSFATLDDKKSWNNYCIENRNHKERILLDSFIAFDFSLLSNSFIFFPIGKKIKELDFIAYSPFQHGIHFLITHRVYDILTKFRLPKHNKIPVKIDTFNESYFLIGFPTLPNIFYDFTKSTFYDYRNGNLVKYKDVEDFLTSEYARSLATPQKLYLTSKCNYDIIKTTKGIYFSSEIIEEFKKENITGYKIIEGILET